MGILNCCVSPVTERLSQIACMSRQHPVLGKLFPHSPSKPFHASSGRIIPRASVSGTGRRSSSMTLQWQPVRRLRDGSENCFRIEAFTPALPALMSSQHLHGLPAMRKWFLLRENAPVYPYLNRTYLSEFREVVVPLELTKVTSDPESGANEESFERAEAPFGVFLDWADAATKATKERLYVAQASILDLPPTLRNDLPTPEIVSKAGKGDVYDTNLWLGVAPTYTPLHRDPNPNLFVQLAGRKVVRLLPPEAGEELFATVQASLGRSASARFRGQEMMAGKEKSLLEAVVWNSPAYERASEYIGQEAFLSQGDGLFVPKGWWHSIKGIGNGITASVSIPLSDRSRGKLA